MGRSILAGLSKLFSTFSEQHLNRKILFEISLPVRYFSASFGSKVCRKIVKIAVFNSRGIVSEKTFVWKKTIGSKMFFGLWKASFPQDCQNFILLYQRNKVWELFLRKPLYSFFSGFGWRVFGMIVKIAFWFSGWTFCDISLLKRT